MALDRDALRRAEGGEASLRVYRWNRPTVSLGRSQRPEDVAAIFPDLPTVPRPTGGGAVLHGHDLTVALALPLDLLGVRPKEVRETYRRIVAPLADALDACGLFCWLAEDRATEAGPDCFAGAGRMDLLHAKTGRKVAGCALATTRSAALLQASIPAGAPADALVLDAETRARYTNPLWVPRWLTQAVPAALRELAPVTLTALDPDLSPRERTDAILWNLADPIRVNDALGALGEYDSYAEELALAETGAQIQTGLDRMGGGIGLPPGISADEFLRLRSGFATGRATREGSPTPLREAGQGEALSPRVAE